jgi:hypothetical protein
MLLAIALAACARRAPSASVSPTAAAPPVATSPPGPRVWPRPLTPEERADFIARAHRAEVNPRRARDGEDLDSPVGWMAQLQEVPYTLCMLQSRDWNRYDYPLADMAIMGTGTFVLEHATAPIDIDAASLAGLRTVVHGYRVYRARGGQPAPLLEDLTRREQAGTLPAYVAERMPACARELNGPPGPRRHDPVRSGDAAAQ